MTTKKYIPPLKDKGFRKWLRDEKNIEDRYLLTLGTPQTIGAYRREYNKQKRK
jgi:hypothetical protein